MADNVRLVTFNGENVTPQDDALLYEKAVGENGIIYGADLSVSGANTIHIDSGFGIICGRFFEISDNDMVVTLSGSGEVNGRVIAHLDLSNTDSPFEIQVQTGNLSPLVQDEDVNIFNGTFEILLATFKVDSLSISNFVDVKPMVVGGFSKEFIANSQNITEEGYALDARQANETINGTLANIIMKSLRSKVENSYKDTLFNFGIDASGRYGYIKAGADSVTPFRNPAGNAAAGDVLSGKTFANASSDSVTGSMPTLSSSDFAGSWSSTTAGAASNYNVKSSKAGYVANGATVHSKAAGTSGVINTTAASGTVDIAITPGVYNKIRVNQTNAYNAGKAAGTKVTVCTNKAMSVGSSDVTLGTVNLTGCNYVIARFKIGSTTHAYDSFFFTVGTKTIYFEARGMDEGSSANKNAPTDAKPKYYDVFVPVTGAANMAVKIKKTNYSGSDKSNVTAVYCYGLA